MTLATWASIGGLRLFFGPRDRDRLRERSRNRADLHVPEPEDLALLGDGRTVIVSQAGSMDGSRSGNIALYRLGDDAPRVAFDGSSTPPATAGWGDPECTAPESFSPHGIDLFTRPDGRLALLVINHGGRESVEFFEVTSAGDATSIAWRGCSIPPEGAYFNDVVGLPDGGFMATHMLERDSGSTLSAQMACSNLTEGACPIAFEIWSLDPESLEGEIVFANEGAPMGAGTVALDIGDSVLIGSFAGDRIIRVKPAATR